MFVLFVNVWEKSNLFYCLVDVSMNENVEIKQSPAIKQEYSVSKSGRRRKIRKIIVDMLKTIISIVTTSNISLLDFKYW